MGWSYGTNAAGREVGYSVQAECDHPVCTAQIDRGLAYACGGMHDADDMSCDRYFCSDHLGMVEEGPAVFLCDECISAAEAAAALGDDDDG